MRIGILTISTSIATGQRRADTSGDILQAIITAVPWQGTIVHRAVIQDERDAIAEILRGWCDDSSTDVILTTGGTGLSPTDVTPEATQAVIERCVPGIAEGLRAETAKLTPQAWLSRGIAGLRGKTLIINLPGSPKAVREYLAVLERFLPHAIDIMTGVVGQHTPLSNTDSLSS